ncbi:MAG TPA: NAD-dependent epimerase/dehydratase family protein [Candidatus Saccharimonadales bacterium]|nr:NAD-dependent epimerase/dehydratase family protein [Candidatus Saccharimonadales bacterium]
MAKKIILVTGGAGHVGSHVIEMLVADAGNQVISLDNYFTGSKENQVAGAEYRTGHTKDIDKLVPETPDIVYHLGEYARIAPSFEDVAEVYDMNIVGTFAVVEFCRTRKVGKLVYAASSTKFAIEGNGRHQNPYSFTKAVNVDLINDYGEWYGLNYAICYFYNAFGPRENNSDKYGTVIGKFERLYLEGKPFTVTKPGTQKRNFTYVKDLARGIILVGEKGRGDGYALNNTKAYSIIEIAEAFGGPIEYTDVYSGRSESGDSPTKARDELGWETTADILGYIKEFTSSHPR